MNAHIEQHEILARELQDSEKREKEFQRYAEYKPSAIARLVGGAIIVCGNLLYGHKPSYAKFRAIEIIARIPYQSWEVFSYCAQTVFFADEGRAVELAKTSQFARTGQDNETMHVVVISQLMRKHKGARSFRNTTLPMLGAFVYFGASFWLYLLKREISMEVNYVFEHHAYEQYSRFLGENEEKLKSTPIDCEFLRFYGREVRNEYEFFELVRNDELIHRNASLAQIEVRG